MDDDFVSDILGTSYASKPTSRLMREDSTINVSMRTLNGSPTQPSFGGPGSPKSGYETMTDSSSDAGPASGVKAHAQAIFRYALIFINFTFIVASLLMMMAGIVARSNSAVRLCPRCSDLTLVSIIFGIILWLFAVFGFNWIRQRNILLLLVYVGFLIVLFLILLGSIVAGSVFDADIERRIKQANFLKEWMDATGNTTDGQLSPLCSLQQRFNCSGFVYGCCRAFNETPGADNVGSCYDRLPNGSYPWWVAEVCPDCPGIPASNVCTDRVYTSLRQNLGGFLVISSFSLFLVTTGIAMSALSRKINQA